MQFRQSISNGVPWEKKQQVLNEQTIYMDNRFAVESLQSVAQSCSIKLHLKHINKLKRHLETRLFIRLWPGKMGVISVVYLSTACMMKPDSELLTLVDPVL